MSNGFLRKFFAFPAAGSPKSPGSSQVRWYLDNQRDHRVANVLYAWGCEDVDCRVLSFEVWTLCFANVAFDITEHLEEKTELVRSYKTQNATVDYVGYVRGLAAVRAFQFEVRAKRTGAAEALFALPGRDYCDLVRAMYGHPYQLNPAMLPLL